jgi:hypothetical protein
MKIEIGELERIEVEADDVEMWHVELILTGSSGPELDQLQRRIRRLAEARLQVVLFNGAADFDPDERSLYFTIAPRTLDLRQEIEEFIGSLTAPQLDEPDYPLSSPFRLFGGGERALDGGLGL